MSSRRSDGVRRALRRTAIPAVVALAGAVALVAVLDGDESGADDAALERLVAEDAAELRSIKAAIRDRRLPSRSASSPRPAASTPRTSSRGPRATETSGTSSMWAATAPKGDSSYGI